MATIEEISLNCLKDKRAAQHVRLKSLVRDSQEGPMHWREEYKQMRVVNLRLEALRYGIDDQQRKLQLIDAILAKREKELQDKIEATRATIKKLSGQIQEEEAK